MSSFSEQFKAAAKKINANIEKIAAKSVIALGQSLVDKSPVGDPMQWKSAPYWPKDYKPGDFKGSWQHGLGAINSISEATNDSTGEASMQRFRAGALANPIGKHYLSNSLPYAARVEYGNADGTPHVVVMSPCAPVALTEIEAPQIIRRVVAGASA